MFDFILDPLATIAQWVGYGIIASFIVGALFLLVAIPIAIKVTAVAVARTIVVETANLIAKSGVAVQVSNAIDSVTVAANQVTNQIQKSNQEFKVIEIQKVEVEK